jgi:hypothetical protein
LVGSLSRLIGHVRLSWRPAASIEDRDRAWKKSPSEEPGSKTIWIFLSDCAVTNDDEEGDVEEEEEEEEEEDNVNFFVFDKKKTAIDVLLLDVFF